MTNFITKAGFSAFQSIAMSDHKDGIEIEATKINLDAGDEVLKQNSQKAYLENYAPERADENAPRVTMAAIIQHDEEVEKKRSEIIENVRSHMEWMIFRDEWMHNRELRWATMSARDAVKLNDFIGNHEVKEKLHQRLCQGGMGRELAEKAIKAFKEYTDLKKQEQAGTLDSAERARMEELGDSRLVKFAQKHAVRLAKKYGLQIDSQAENDSEVAAAPKLSSSFQLWMEQVKGVTGGVTAGEVEASPKRGIEIDVKIIKYHDEVGLSQNFDNQVNGKSEARNAAISPSQQKRAEAEPALVLG